MRALAVLLRLTFLVGMFGGCGRIAFDPLSDAATDAATDAPRVTCDWSNGPKLRTAPMLHPELSSPTVDVDPYLVPGDPTTIYLTSARSGAFDIFTATRPSVDQPFGAPTPVPGFATAVDESCFNLERGGQTGYVTLGSTTFEVTRDGTGGFVVGRELTELNVSAITLDAFPAGDDGTLLMFSSGPDLTTTDIMVASRPDRGAPWSNIMPIPFNTANPEGGATVTADGLVMVWAGNGQSLDIFYSVRPSTSVPFTEIRTMISTPALEHEPVIRDDGCELFFAEIRGATEQDIMSVEILP